MYNFGSEECIKRFNRLPLKLKTNPLTNCCFKLNTLYLHKNFQRVLDQVEALPIILKISLNKHLANIHSLYFRTICIAYSSKSYNFEMIELADRLIPFESCQQFKLAWCKNLCDKFNLSFNSKNMILMNKSSFNFSAKVIATL